MESSRVGAGAADVTRRELSEDEARAVVAAEVAERRKAAGQVRGIRPERAAELTATADLLAELLARQ